jgi:hypothetical protein
VIGMLRMHVTVLALSAVVLAACAGSYQVVRMPQRDADLYPYSETKEGVTIAIDEIADAARAERYFGADLIKYGVLPLAVVVSNHGDRRVLVKPSDVLLHRRTEIVDPLPVETVVALAKSQRWFLHSKTEQQIDSFFASAAFRETVLLPDETYQGIMFFLRPKPKDMEDKYFSAISLFREGGPKIRVGVTDMETHERVHFGPFTVSLEEERFEY